MHPSTTSRPRGFALVVTLSLMVLLAIIAVGLLSLSAVTFRSSSQGTAQAQAQTNARMALMIAIGELQKQMGPDQRISASGSNILNVDGTIPGPSELKNPHWTGVWNSWKAGTGEISQHSSIAPPANPLSGVMAPTYELNRANSFRSWLVSLDPAEVALVTSARDLSLNGVSMPTGDATDVQLVGKGSLGASATTTDCVSARLIKVIEQNSAKPTGRYGWWVGDESQKARIMDDSYQSSAVPLTSAEKIFRSQAPGSTGTKRVEGLEDMSTDTQLAGLPSLATLDLVTGATGRPAQKNFLSVTPHSYQVLADVREGGLKRDLSTLLERKIDNTETGDQFMLYKFGTKDVWASEDSDPSRLDPLLKSYKTPQECVPIQDLAAYYQLYDGNATNVSGIDHSTWKQGVKYNSTSLPDTIQTSTPDYGTAATYQTKFSNEYTTLYRNPVLVKVQFIMSLSAVPITAADRAFAFWGTQLQNHCIPLTDTHQLKVAVVPAVTLWNPYNAPIVMQSGNDLCQQFVLKPPAFYINCQKWRAGTLRYNAGTISMASLEGQGGGRCTDLIKMNFGRTSPISFQPGEVKVFSIPSAGGASYTNQADWQKNLLENNYSLTKNLTDAAPGWDPNGYFLFPYSVSSRSGTPSWLLPPVPTNSQFANVVAQGTGAPVNVLTGANLSLDRNADTLKFSIGAEDSTHQISVSSSPVGAGMCFYMEQRNYSAGFTGYNRNYLNLRHSGLVSRFGATWKVNNTVPYDFNQQLIAQGMPGGANLFPLEDISASTIIDAGSRGKPFLQMAIMAGCETGELAGGGAFSGRKFPSRPFLHSSPIQPTFIDQNDKAAPYNHGWNWWMEDLNSILEAQVQVTPEGNGYYGGGYTSETGVSRVIQQEIPVTPPISIAALSHARLGGFTLAHEAPAAEGKTGTFMEYFFNTGTAPAELDYPKLPTKSFQRVTATGQAGLYPHVLQAIGNSYANPNLAADAAYNPEWKRLYDKNEGERKVTFADHSYLANKALWDEFFFSSITPQPATVKIFGGSHDRDAKTVASDFFFPATGAASKPLPNRRIQAYTNGLDSTKLTTLFTQKDVFTDGLADKIAANLMVKGPFNINSTSVEAWKVLFSSLKGKPVAYLDGGTTPKTTTATGTPVGPGTLPYGSLTPVTSITSPNEPPEQWNSWRDITDSEIDALATAMVKQVKLRGPFLSLSEFVNRRLEGSDTPEKAERSIKGALQAALDDDSVPINANFREPGRMLDSETSAIPFAFDAAAKGPIAYGSAAYIDQADILRNLAEQLTPRGDTFVIRTYGDALDPKGNVIARAWCEAVVQRIPDYTDSKDEAYLKQSALTSAANKMFGRKMQIISFRWLNPSEV